MFQKYFFNFDFTSIINLKETLKLVKPDVVELNKIDNDDYYFQLFDDSEITNVIFWKGAVDFLTYLHRNSISFVVSSPKITCCKEMFEVFIRKHLLIQSYIVTTTTNYIMKTTMKVETVLKPTIYISRNYQNYIHENTILVFINPTFTAGIDFDGKSLICPSLSQLFIFILNLMTVISKIIECNINKHLFIYNHTPNWSVVEDDNNIGVVYRSTLIPFRYFLNVKTSKLVQRKTTNITCNFISKQYQLIKKNVNINTISNKHIFLNLPSTDVEYDLTNVKMVHVQDLKILCIFENDLSKFLM